MFLDALGQPEDVIGLPGRGHEVRLAHLLRSTPELSDFVEEA
jgi:hypothetical protein